MSSCGAKYVLHDCQCLADPLDFYSTMCGYVSKRDGLVYACDPGCCGNTCDNKNPNITRVETRPSAGVDLPPGYGDKLMQSVEPSLIPGSAPFEPVPGPNYKVWQIVLIALVPLILVIIMGMFLT
jgi:hypothetical protein